MTSHSAYLPAPSRLHRLHDLVVDIAAGLDAAARISHGCNPARDHPARARADDRAELERRLAARFPRT